MKGGAVGNVAGDKYGVDPRGRQTEERESEGGEQRANTHTKYSEKKTKTSEVPMSVLVEAVHTE